MCRTGSRKQGDDNDGDIGIGNKEDLPSLSGGFENKGSFILDVLCSCLSVLLLLLHISKGFPQLSIIIFRYSYLYILIEQFDLPYSGIRQAGFQSSAYRIQGYGLGFFFTTNLTL